MIIAPHWKLRSYMHELRRDESNPRTRRDARLPLLLALMLHCNTRLRCWPSTDLLCGETGFGSECVVEAREWLIAHKAVELVPYEKREGKERELPQRQFVYQLTGVIETSCGPQPYLIMTPEAETQAQKEFEVSKSETSNAGKVSESKVSESKVSVSETKGSTSIKGKTTPEGNANTPNGGLHNTPPTSVIHLHDAPNTWQDDPAYVYIGRGNSRAGVKLSKWRNAHRVGKDGKRDEVIALFEQDLLADSKLLAALPDLVGKTLVCWCAPEACHGDVLADYANRYAADDPDVTALVEQAREDNKTPHQRLMQALAEVWGIDLETATPTKKKEFGRVASELKGADPDQIPAFHHWLKTKAKNDEWHDFTINVYPKYWDNYLAEQQQNQAAEQQRPYSPPATLDEQMRKASIVRYMIDHPDLRHKAPYVTLDDMREGKYDDILEAVAA